MRCPLAVLAAASSAVLGLLSPALAADYDPPTLRGSETQFIPTFPRYTDWSGFYAGGQLGYGVSRVDFRNATQPLLATAFQNLSLETEDHASTTEVLGTADGGSAGFGGFVGYNMQFDNTVLGLELNYTHVNFNAGAPNFPIGRDTGVLSNNLGYQYTLDGSGSMRTTDIALLQARAGYVSDRMMPFATFGAALGRADIAASVSCDCKQYTVDTSTKPPTYTFIAFPFSTGESKNSTYIWGYTGGVGLDFALTSNIFGRIDYEYIQWAHFFSITSHVQMAHAGLGLKF